MHGFSCLKKKKTPKRGNKYRILFFPSPPSSTGSTDEVDGDMVAKARAEANVVRQRWKDAKEHRGTLGVGVNGWLFIFLKCLFGWLFLFVGVYVLVSVYSSYKCGFVRWIVGVFCTCCWVMKCV